jgi:TP901 family phage tail tape measure protein
MALKIADILVQISADARSFNTTMEGVAGRMKQTGRDMEKVGSGLSTYVSLPLLGIGLASAKMAMEFNSSMTKMVTLANQSQEQVNAWREDFEQMAHETGINSTELANAMFRITSGGLTGERALAALKASAMGAALGMGETATVAFATVSAMNAYGLAADQADKVVAQLMWTVRQGNMETSTLADTLGAVMPIASEMGVGLDQVGASIASMTRLGADAHMAVTALRQVMATLIDPTSQADDLLESVGLSASGLRAQIREKGLLSVLITLKDAFAGNEEAMSTMFPNIRALTGVLNMAGKNIGATAEITRSLANATGKDLTDAMAIKAAGAGHAYKVALADLHGSMVKLGEETLPVFIQQLNSVAGAATGAANAFNGWDPAVKEATVNVGLFLIALGPGLKLTGMFYRSVASGALAISGLSTMLTLVRTPLTGLGGIMLGGTGAVGGMAAAIGLVSSALVVMAGYIGWLTGGKINEWLMKQETWLKLTGQIANQESEYAKQLRGDSELWETTWNSYEKMREKLGAVGDEYYISKERTKESAAQMAAMYPTLARQVSLHNQEAQALRERNAAEETDSAGKIAAATEKAKLTADYVAKLHEEYGILTREDILSKLAARTQHYRDMVAMQVSGKQIQDSMVPLLTDEIALLGEYKVGWTEIPEETRKMLSALALVSPELQKQVDMVGAIGPQYEFLASEIKFQFNDPNTGVAYTIGDSLKGGFTKGFSEGIDAGRGKLVELRQELKENPVKVPAEVVVSWPNFQKLFDDYMAGLVPQGGGAVP